MCNLYRLEKNVDAIRRMFADVQIPLTFPEGVPNLQATDVRITDPAPIVRLAEDGRSAELVVRRWSWPGPGGKPVFNLRSEGREFAAGRALAIADGFYEYTTPTDPKQKRKDCWLFRPSGEQPIAIAAVTRNQPPVGEAFALLTVGPGEDVAAYHNRQIALIEPGDWARWLDGSVFCSEMLKPSERGKLAVAAA